MGQLKSVRNIKAIEILKLTHLKILKPLTDNIELIIFAIRAIQ